MKLQIINTKQTNRFIAKNEEDHQTAIEISSDQNNKSMLSPLELLASSLGGCMMVDIDSISRKQKQAIDSIQINLDVDREKVNSHTEFKKITVDIIMKGKEISKKKLEKAIELTTDKYCSVYKILSKSIPIDVKYTIIESL